MVLFIKLDRKTAECKNLVLEAAYLTETFAPTSKKTWCHNPEDIIRYTVSVNYTCVWNNSTRIHNKQTNTNTVPTLQR